MKSQSIPSDELINVEIEKVSKVYSSCRIIVVMKLIMANQYQRMVCRRREIGFNPLPNEWFTMIIYWTSRMIKEIRSRRLPMQVNLFDIF